MGSPIRQLEPDVNIPLIRAVDPHTIQSETECRSWISGQKSH